MKTFETADEAFNYMLTVVNGLFESGIPVEISEWYKNPHPRGKESEKHQREMIEKYNGPECASYKKWCNICFRPKTQEQADDVFQAQCSLGWLGITFDSGGGCGGRDWQTDWSFSYKQPSYDDEDGDREEALEWLENTLREVDPIGEIE